MTWNLGQTAAAAAGILAVKAGVYGSQNNGLSRSIRKVRNRVGRARWAFVGDSLYAGAGAGTITGVAINPPGASQALSMPQQLAALLKTAGIPTRSDA